MKRAGSIVTKLRNGEVPMMRHQNPYLKEALELENIVYTPEEIAAKGLQIFPTEQPFVLEVGCYLGKTVIELAQQNPGMNFLGIDLTYKRTVKSGRKIVREKISNARIGICEARNYITQLNSRKVFEGTCVFFPDPWNKLSQRKNRLLTESFLDLLFGCTKVGGFFWFKTDHKEYYAEAVQNALNTGWVESVEGLVPNSIQGVKYQTAFEKMFEEKGEPTYQIIFRKLKERE